MAKYRTLKPRKFSLEFRYWRQASAHGGQLAVAALLEQFGLKERVLRELLSDLDLHHPPCANLNAVLAAKAAE
jgi:hypothetical protein